MKYFIPVTVSITASSIAEGTDQTGATIPPWVNTSGYIQGTSVSHNKRISRAFTNIPALATYTWNDPSSAVAPVCTRLSDGVSITPVTAVPCVLNTTVIYIQVSYKDTASVVTGRYFKYTGASGNVDFTAINPSAMTNWTEVLGYRYLAAEPIEGNTLYWEDLGATNRNRATDKAYNSQSVRLSTESEYWEFKLSNAEEVVLFNIQAQSARIVAYTTSISTPFYDNTISSLLDTTGIVNWRTLSQYTHKYTKGAKWTLPFYSGEVTIRIYLMHATAGTVALGEILAGRNSYVGATLDGVPIQLKSSGVITELTNGDIVFADEGNITKVYTLLDFVVKFESSSLDFLMDRASEMINRRIVLFAENSDIQSISSLTVYGFIRDASPTYNSNSTKSDIKIQVQRLK